MDAAEAAIKAASGPSTLPQHEFSGAVEHAIAHIEEAALNDMPENQQRWYAIKIFESDEKVLEKLKISDATLAKKELCWEAEYGIDEMCADSWRWQSMNPDGYGA